MLVGVFYLRGLSDVTEVVALSRARTCSRSESKLCMTGLRDKPRPPAFGPELCLLLQFLVTGSLPEARCPAEAFLRASHMPFLLCLPPGQLWYQYSPLGRMTDFNQIENSPGSLLCRIQNRPQKVTSVSLPLFHGHGIFQYSFGLLPHCRPITTVDKPRPRLGVGRLQGKGPGLSAARGHGMGQVLLCPHGAHILDWETVTQADNHNTRQSGMRTVTEAQRTMVTTDY